MLLIGVDYHPSFQATVFCEEETRECGGQSDGQAERFYRGLQQRGISVRVGMEATRYSRWFKLLYWPNWVSNCGWAIQRTSKPNGYEAEDRPQGCHVATEVMRENNFPQVWVLAQKIGICDMTLPGVGPMTALAYVLIIGTPTLRGVPKPPRRISLTPPRLCPQLPTGHEHTSDFIKKPLQAGELHPVNLISHRARFLDALAHIVDSAVPSPD
jgi:hypothetical protein